MYVTSAPRTFLQILERGGELYGENPAIVFQGRSFSYSDLLLMARRLAASLRDNGVAPGDRVVLALPNSWQFVVSAFAISMTGAILVPLDVAIRPGNFLHIIRDCAVKGIILDHAVFSRVEPVLKTWPEKALVLLKEAPFTARRIENLSVVSLDSILEPAHSSPPGKDPFLDVDPQTVTSITYTSGSTGQPKGVMHTHSSWITSAFFTGSHFKLSKGDKILISLPLHHAYSFRHVLAYLIYGGTIVLTKDLYEALKSVRTERPAAWLLVPTAGNIILKHFSDLMKECASFLEIVSIGTAAMAAVQLQALQALLPDTRILLPYGLTEARVGFLRMGRDATPNHIYAVAPGLDVQVVNDRGEAAQKGETGEIILKGEGMMAGYWKSSDAERRMLQERGFPTGDMGRVGDHGEIALVGRIDDIVKVGGRKVAPYEIEGVLNQHPSVFECVVLGVEEHQDVQLKAVVVLKEGKTMSEGELIHYCRQHLEPYKVPSTILFKASLPKSSVGKLLKNVPEEE